MAAAESKDGGSENGLAQSLLDKNNVVSRCCDRRHVVVYVIFSIIRHDPVRILPVVYLNRT